MKQSKAKSQTTKIIVGSIILIALWIASGLFAKRDFEAESTTNTTDKTKIQIKLEVENFVAQNKRRIATIQGETIAVRDVNIMAETVGKVAAIIATEGSQIAKGAPILQLEMKDRKERLTSLEALVAQRQTEYQVAEKLAKKGFESKVRLLRSKADLTTAKANLKQAQLEIEFTTIKAPFSGFLEKINVKVGDLVSGGTVAHLVDLNPILVAGELAQADRLFVDNNQPVEIVLQNSQKYNGKIRYISRAADKSSRAFAVEVEVDNPKYEILSGLSATIKLPLNEVQAHFIPASSLSLRDDGKVQIKALDAENKVQLHEVKIISEENGGIWVEGLPENLRIITKGQAYAAEGEVVASANIDEKPQAEQN